MPKAKSVIIKLNNVHEFADKSFKGPAKDLLLTALEARDLDRAELKIAAGLKSFMEVGLALREIRDKKLYRHQACVRLRGSGPNGLNELLDFKWQDESLIPTTRRMHSCLIQPLCLLRFKQS